MHPIARTGYVWYRLFGPGLLTAAGVAQIEKCKVHNAKLVQLNQSAEEDLQSYIEKAAQMEQTVMYLQHTNKQLEQSIAEAKQKLRKVWAKSCCCFQVLIPSSCRRCLVAMVLRARPHRVPHPLHPTVRTIFIADDMARILF